MVISEFLDTIAESDLIEPTTDLNIRPFNNYIAYIIPLIARRVASR